MYKYNALLTTCLLIKSVMYQKRHLLTKGRTKNLLSCSMSDSIHQSVDLIQIFFPAEFKSQIPILLIL